MVSGIQERIERAIDNALELTATVRMVGGPYEAIHLRNLQEKLHVASRAVIEALREPTPHMRWRGQDAVGSDIRFVSPQDIWQAMITAALE